MSSDSENSKSSSLLLTSPTDEDDDDDYDRNIIEMKDALLHNPENVEYENERRILNGMDSSLSRSSSWSSSSSGNDGESSWETDDLEFQSFYFQGDFENKVFVNHDRDTQEIIVEKYGGFFDLDGVWSSSVLHNLHVKLKDTPEYQKIAGREKALVEAACITARTEVFNFDQKNRHLLMLECLLSHHDLVKFRKEINEQENKRKIEIGTQTFMDVSQEEKEEKEIEKEELPSNTLNVLEEDKDLSRNRNEDCIHTRTITFQDNRFEKLLKENFVSRNWSKNALKYSGRKIVDDIFESL